MSRKVARLQHFNHPDLELSLDLKPALPEDKLDARILRDSQEFSKASLKEIVRKLIPQPLVGPVLDAAYLDGNKPVSQITKNDRQELIRALKHFTIL